jgi:hypothetical protein
MRGRVTQLLARAAVSIALFVPYDEPAAGNRGDQSVSVETICTTAKDCRVKLSVGEGSDRQAVVTAFRANRVGPDMKYFPADEYGSCDFRNPGLLYLDSQVVLDGTDTLRPPGAGDPPEALLTLTTTFGVDPAGHVTFFSGVLHAPGEPVARRSYLWGYPPSTVKTIGAVGGPRSPVAARRPSPPRVLKGGMTLGFRVECSPENHCRVTVDMARGDSEGTAVTYFRANRLGEDLRYFPAEKERGTRLATTGATYLVELDVVVDEAGAMHSPGPRDPPGAAQTLTSTIALDDSGHVTFFYGFVRDPDSSRVRRFCIWGYPPETLMIDGPHDEATARPPDPDRRI